MTRRGRWHCLLAVTVMSAGALANLPARAEDAPAEPAATPEVGRLSLAEAVTQALARGPALQAAAELEQQARSKVTAARRSRFGEIDAVAAYSRYQDDQIVRPIARQLLAGGFADLPFDRNQWRYGLTFRVPLYLGGRLSASIAAASLQADEAAALVEGSLWQTRFNVTSLYASAQTLAAVARATDANLVALEEVRRKLDLAVQIGKRPELDRLKVVDEIAGARARRAGVEANAARVRASLLALLGRDPAGVLHLDPFPESLPVLAVSRDELRGLVLAASPVARASLAAQQAHQAARIAHAAFLPSVAASGHYMRSEAPSVAAPYNTWEVSVGLTMPVFAGGSRFAELAAARHGEEAAATALTRARLDQEARLVEARARWDAAGTVLEAATAGVTAAREAARIEQIRYDTGAGAIDDLLRARARELSSEAALAQARGDVIVAAARINSVCEKEVVP